MDQDLVTSLVEELHVSEDLARIAVMESQGELELAREILQGLLPRYLFIKAQFVPKRSGANGGLILILVEKGASRFTVFKTIFESDRDWLNGVNVRLSPAILNKVFEDYYKEHTGGHRMFDAQQLKDRLAAKLNPAGLQYLFDLWDCPKTEVIENSNPLDTYHKPGDILHMLLLTVLGEILVEKISLTIDYDFYTEAQFGPIREKLGLAPKDSGRNSLSGPKKLREGLKVYLKGRFAIDAVNGTPVHALETYDSVYCEIMDRSDVSVSVARLIGAYKQGLWLPVKGKITEISEAIGDRNKFRVMVTPGVYIDVLSFTDLLVRTADFGPRERVQRSSDSTEEFNPLPLLIAVVLLALLVMSLLLAR
jgi:hypothetical protein